MRIETLAIHSSLDIDPSTGAVHTPITLTTTFERDTDGEYPRGYIYSRLGNPTRSLLEKSVAQLENGSEAMAFSSGMAAIMGVFQTLSPNDHVIVPKDIFHGTTWLLTDLMKRWQLESTFIDMSNLSELRSAIRTNTKMIFIETPSNPLLKITDVREVANLAKDLAITTVADNTWSSPIGLLPLEFGIDIVIHSTTKYFGGHGDVTGGIVVTKKSDDLSTKIRDIQINGGAIPSPFDCWLILRGIKTLPYRMRAHSENAGKLARFLQSHPQVDKVYFPWLETNPGYQIAKSQMKLSGGMLSFQPIGNSDRAYRVAANTKLFTRATSLGTYLSLIEHRASIEGPETQAPDNLLRVSVGLENIDDLMEDIDQALNASI